MQSRYAYLYEFDTEPKRAADAETLEKRLHPDIGQLADRSRIIAGTSDYHALQLKKTKQ